MSQGKEFHMPLCLDWFDAMALRASTRSFDGRSIQPDVLDRIQATCEQLRGSAPGGVRAEIVRSVPAGLFTSIVGSYGAVSGATAFAALVAREDRHLEVGYLGEAIVLEATAAGLDTCWIAGDFAPARAARLVELAPGEAIRAVVPLGHAAPRRRVYDFIAQTAVQSRRRLPLETIAPGAHSWPGWAGEAARAARLAPSGKNAQPWRLRLENDSLVVARKPGRLFWTASMDCGIAMLHAELGALHAGVVGRWERLAGPDVARFVARERTALAAAGAR